MNLKREEDENKDINYDPMMPHMADGGLVDDPEGDPVPHPEDIPQPTPEPAHVAEPNALAPKAGLPGMPAEVGPDAFQQFMGEQKAGMEKYGPEQQMAVQNALIKARTSPGMALAHGAAGLSDAIMQGVARAGSSGNLKGMRENENQLSNEVSGTMQKANEQKMQQMSAQMKLAQEYPASPISKIAQQTEGPTLIQLGAKPQDIAKMPASLIGDLLAKKITLQDALARIEETATTNRAMIGLKGMEAKGNIAHQQAEDINRSKETGLKADVEASKHWITHPSNAASARKRISEGSSGAPTNSFSTEAEAEAAGLPAGTEVMIGGRRARVK